MYIREFDVTRYRICSTKTPSARWRGTPTSTPTTGNGWWRWHVPACTSAQPANHGETVTLF